MSTCETLTGRVNSHKTLLWNLVKTRKKHYLLNLRECYSVKQRGTRDCNIAVGDIAILKDDLTKRLFRRLAIVKELLSGKDGHVRAAMVHVSATDKRPTLLRCSVKHLIPLEVRKELN